MSLPNPTVTITVQDNGASAAIAVPQQQLQLVIGCAIGGTVNQPFATTQAQSVQQQFIGGPLVEAAGLTCAGGGTVVCVSCPINTHGVATAVTTTVPNGSTSVVTLTLDATHGAWDTMYMMIRCVAGGTIGTAPGPGIQISRDAGRTWGPVQYLGTATTLVIGSAYATPAAGGTGITANFGAGTMVGPSGPATNPVYDTWQWSTTGPLWNVAGVVAALQAFGASQYAVAGVGSIHIVGPAATSDIASIQTELQTLATQFVFNRAIVELRDASPPTVWGGSAETEAAWIIAMQAIGSASTAQPRVCADGGWYNTPSVYATPDAGLPVYRRPLAWSHAVRRVQIGLATRAGWVLLGPYGNITVNPQTDPTDGFIYHNERLNPGLTAANIGAAQTWPKKGQGFFQSQEPLLAAPGSQFTELVIGNVLDAACDIAYAEGVNLVSSSLLTQANGTLDPIELNTIQGDIQTAENEGLIQTPLVSDVTVTISPTYNVQATGKVPITVSVLPFGYVNEIDETVNIAVAGAP